MKMPNHAIIKEVGPRDGLQNEASILATEHKVEWINHLSETGLSYIEISSFVHPKWIPQLADALEVARNIQRHSQVTYAALVPNKIGLKRALEANLDEISVFMSASETHNKKNINKTIAETLPVLESIVREAKQHGLSVRGYLSTVFGCPYEGEVAIDQVITLSQSLFNMGIDELSLGDTIGVANPKQVANILIRLREAFPHKNIALHFHDTRGTALANCLTALQLGFNTFDSSLGGLGGCPYAKGASGNLATDDLLYMLEGMGIATGINRKKLLQAAQYIQGVLPQPLPSHHMQIFAKGGNPL
ncbi:hydroxymethylglutaryl-CoA lyase [Pullulanibacillus pueri]|uniref:Hydroxymethylglutaryl-CoA lyase YngG n=1 Tax=Pullulanibacillus pueri TaxID=1437324 RepID=A0A8J2ZTH9_9BACL|nr:hydroxymethylglutaryl-CoA lyase [Pullulanibacillus pueri]MBM7681292.1 hydroxymethylglutaryl-CoA lyase [Pullulanibacillus pueri]GGH77715.1 hydroxymethylglutaryl-CoA lyase YngG [Pullulanibacillus pueri]